MPNKDKTGPKGEGPKTGRQAGNCKGIENPQKICCKGFQQRRRKRGRQQ